MADKGKKRDGFGSKLGVIAAAAGSAIGLGNIYRFPCELGENGGAAFLLVYLAVVLLLGVPLMLSEFVIGRYTQSNAVGAFKKLVPNTHWSLVGYMGVLCGFLILMFYSTVSGWTLEYIVKSVANDFAGKDLPTIEQGFSDFHNMGFRNVIWQGTFLFLTAFVVYRGVRDGIEKYTKVLMPLLLLILVVLGVRSVMLPGAYEGLKFLFHPDFSKLTAGVVISALGQGFFSLSMGMGVLITYGSYINKKDNLVSTAFSVTLSDTLVAVLAGIVIFPAAFSFGIRPSAGMGLVFNTLPMIFNSMSGGYIICIVFFVLLAIAALTSTISVLEVIVAYISEEFHISRKKATVVATLATFAFGIFASLSLMDNTPFKIGGTTFFNCLDFVSSTILLPLGGLLIVIFVGWRLNKQILLGELTNHGSMKAWFIKFFLFMIKYVAPLAIMAIFISQLLG